MILLAHPTANQNVRQTALALAEAGLLAEFWTCINWRQSGFLDTLLRSAPRLRNELRRRSFPEQLTPFLRTYPWREWGRQLGGQLGWDALTRTERGLCSIDSVYLSLDRQVARRIGSSLTNKAVYAYDGGALETFRAARKRGLVCIYEHPIVHWRLVRQLQEEEAQLHPEWAPTLGGLADSAEKLDRKDEELALADIVITPSSFAKESLAMAPTVSAPIHVVLYGADLARNPIPKRSGNGKLRVLFVGPLSQAKGLGYLLEAADHLKNEIELTLIGRRISPLVPAAALLHRYRWIPSLAHRELLSEMSQHDLLVLPSLHEGFGLVLTEAMSQGLAIITTSHTAGPDLISDGGEGFLVPVRSAAAIEEKLALLSRERDRLIAMQQAARDRAMSLSWQIYRQRLIGLAREVVAG